MKIAALCREKEPTYRPSISDVTSMLMGTERTNVQAVQGCSGTVFYMVPRTDGVIP